jgi:gas vesicle protein
MKSGKFVMTMLLAATAGAAIALLFAPDKGERTRRKIKEKGEDYLDDLKEGYERSVKQVKRKVGTAYDELAERVEQLEKA